MGKITLSKAEYDRIMNYGTEKDPEYDPDALTYDDYVYGADAIRRRSKYLQSFRDYLSASGTANNVTGSFAGQERTNADSYRSELQGFLRYLETASKSALERGNTASYRAISQARDSLNVDPSSDYEEEKQYLNDAKDAVTRQSERNRDYLGVRNPRGLDFHFSNAFGQSDKQSSIPGLTTQNTFGKNTTDSVLSAASRRTKGQAADEARENNYAQMDPALAEEALMGFYATHPQDYTTNLPYTTAGKDRLTELAQQLRVSQRENEGSIARQRQKALEEEAARRQAWFDERADKYANIPLKDDFEQNISGWEDVGKANDPLMTEAARGYELTVPLENRDADTQNALKQQEADSAYNVSRMSPTERKVYRYLQNTEGKEAAQDYMDYLSYRLNARNMNEVRAAAERGTETTGGKIVHSALSVPANLAGGALGAADYAIQNVRSKFSYRPIDYNSGGQIPGEYASAVRENTQEDMGNVGRFVYGTAMSMADSAASMLTIGKGGGALLGLSAGRQGVKDAIDAGATDSQAIAMGLFNGAAEMIFENIGIDNLYSILESGGTRTLKSAVKSILGQALSEGTEEVGTTLANTWGDAMIMADKSEINRTIDEYMSEGASREQATRAAWLNWAQNLGMDFLGGLTSGALFGIGGTIIANAKNDSEIGQIIKRDGLSDGMRIEDAISEVTNVPNLYSNSTDTLALYIRESGIENVSDRTLGRFYRLFTQDQQNLRSSGLFDVDVAEYVERGMEPYQEPRTNVEPSIARDESGNVDVEQTLRNAAQETTAMEVARENEQNDADTRRAWEDALSMQRQNAKASNQNMPVTAEENAQERSVASPEESVVQTQKASQTAENGVQAAYVKGGRISNTEMSDSGAAKNNVQLASGETAQVQNISVSDNGVVLETSRGKALADDVQIDDPSLYTIVSAAEKYDTQGAQALFRGYENSDLSAQNYVRAFESAYESGHVGLDYGTFLEKGGYATFLDKDTRMAAYAAGQRVFTSDKETAGVRGGVVEKFSGELTREQRGAVNALNAYGRAIGRTINIVDSIDVKKKDGSVRKSGANAMFNPKTNEYTIALDAQGQAYVAVALHESVHDISANQPQMYDMLHTTVMEYLKMEGEDIDTLRAEWRDRIGDMSDAEIDEEIVGNTVPVILSDKETAQDFAERFLDSDEKKSAFRRLIDSILDFLKRAYDKLKNLKSWRTMKTLEGNIQAVQDIREVMFDALDELRNGNVKQNDSAVEIKESRKTSKKNKKPSNSTASPLSRGLEKQGSVGSTHIEMMASTAAAELLGVDTITQKSDGVNKAISALGEIYASIESGKPVPGAKKAIQASNLIGNMVRLGILERRGQGGSAYRSDGGHTLRVSNHTAHAENFVDQGENLSIALFKKGKMNDFLTGKSDAIEAVFRKQYLDEHPDVFKNMIGDIARFIATGEYHDTAGALTYHYSGSERFVQEAQDRMLNDAVQRQINSVDEETAQRIIADEDGVRYSSRDIDTETLDMLESLDEDELITTYRSMQLIDGKLYPPMAAVVSGSMEDASQIGSWERAVEHPELVKIDNKGRAKFTLNKGKGQGTISAAYNPYMHSSNLMLNDQFTGAYKRPNLVTVECVVPASEMTSGYHAEFAKDATGWHEWHAGPVASNVSEQRNVFLSRWLKPVRIVDNAEVAREYQRLLSGTNASVPYNVVSPGLLAELEKIGVPIDNKGSGKVPPRDDIRHSVREGMSEEERYEALKDATIRVPAYDSENGVLTQQSVANLERMINRDARYYVGELFDKLGIGGTYENKAANIVFNFGSHGKSKSIHEQGARRNGFSDFAKMLTNFDAIVENAVPIEIHSDKYRGTRRENADLRQVSVFVSAFYDNGGIVPVQFEVKEYANRANELYVIVSLQKIRDAVVATGRVSETDTFAEAGHISYAISLQELFSKINPSDGDFLKYVPDGFLSEEQRSAKQAALMREERKIDGLRFSLRDTSSVDIATVEKENAQLREANEELRKQFKRTVGVQLDQKAIRKMARDLLKQYDSSYDVDTLTDNLSKVFDVVANGGLTWDEASSAVVDMCRKVLEESSSFDAELYEYDQPVRDYLKNVRLEISDDMRGGIELVADNGASYRRGLFGIVGTAKKGSGVSIDQMWREASEMFPAYFSEDIVNAEDQAERLYHLAQRLKKSSYFVNAFAQNIDAAAYDMMLQIGAKYPGIPHTQTFADKFAAKVNEARAKTKKAYDAKLAQLRAQQKTANRTARRLDAKATKIANRMLQQQARYESQLESQNKKIERMEAARDKAKDTARRKKYRDRISKNATALYQWLAKPTDKAHVPENIRAAVTQLVRAIDLSSGTKYGEAWRQRLSALADQFDKSTLDAAYQSFANSIDPDLTTDIRAFVDSQTGVTVSDMDADHLQTLSELLNRVKKAVTEANKFHAAERSRTVQEVAIKTREEFNRKRVFSETKNGKAVQAIIDFNQADAATLFHYLGKEAETIYNAVRQGFDEYVFHVRDAQQYATEVLKKAGDKKQYSKTHKFHVDGKDIELSVAQIMTLYELSQRPQAAEHLYDGGIVLIKRSATGTQKEKTHVRVTKQDVADMIAVLTDPQKTVADALQRFLQEDSAAWGNDATMTVYGYRKFGEDHYFPIDSDRDFISTSGKDSSNNGDLYALRNWRSSKSTVEGASNPLIVGDIFDVWTKHVSEMAKYGAYLAPMDDMLKWYNWRGRDGSGRQISVRESLNGAFGKKNAAKFVETFIKNINGSGRIDVAAQDKIFDTMVRNAKAAAVGANLSVAIQQPTAYARAYAEIGLKYLSLAFAQKPNTQLAQQYCPIAQWKAWGFFDVNVGPILKSVILGDKTWLEKIREVQMFLPELGDNVTWGYIWNACALEVADKENVPPDQRNTEEFYQKVGRRMSEVIDKTQVVDSPFTRSFISSNKGYQAFTAFRNEPMKSYNMLTRAAYDNVYEHTKETKKHLRRSIVAFVAAGVFAAMGKAIISALRRNDDKKGDSWAEKALIRLGMTEEGRYTYGQKWMVSTLEETADNIFPLNTHWLTSAIVEMIERAVSGTNYSSGRIDEKTISSIEDFAKLIKKLAEGKDVETYRLVYKGAEMVSYLTGIGFQSLLKDGKGIWNAVSDAISPDYTPTMDDAFILIERGDVGSVEIAAALEAAANEILAKTPSISEEKAMQDAESKLRTKVTNRYKDDYINAFEKGYTQKAKQIAEWMYATGLYEDRDAVDDVVLGWLVGYYKEAYLAAKTDAERSNIFEKLYATKKWRNRAELKKAIRGWTEVKN